MQKGYKMAIWWGRRDNPGAPVGQTPSFSRQCSDQISAQVWRTEGVSALLEAPLSSSAAYMGAYLVVDVLPKKSRRKSATTRHLFSRT